MAKVEKWSTEGFPRATVIDTGDAEPISRGDVVRRCGDMRAASDTRLCSRRDYGTGYSLCRPFEGREVHWLRLLTKAARITVFLYLRRCVLWESGQKPL